MQIHLLFFCDNYSRGTISGNMVSIYQQFEVYLNRFHSYYLTCQPLYIQWWPSNLLTFMNCICMTFTLLFIEVSKTENEMLRMCECSRVWITTLVLKKKRKGFQTTLWEFTKATKTFIKSILISILLKKYIFAFFSSTKFSLYEWVKESR